jgi:hypothetical protein
METYYLVALVLSILGTAWYLHRPIKVVLVARGRKKIYLGNIYRRMCDFNGR